MSKEIRIPLLHDHHTHPMLYAAFMGGLDLGGFPEDSRESAVARVRRHARGEGWSIAYGWNSGRYSLEGADFDDLGPLVVLNLSLHGLIVNAAGRLLLATTDPEAAMRLDDQDWLERNLRRVLNLLAGACSTPEQLAHFFRWLRDEHGVFHAEEMLLVSESEIDLLGAAGLLDRTTLWAPPALFDELSEPRRALVHGIKLFTDGALGARTAALHEPYVGTGGLGVLLHTDDELRAAMEPHLRAGRPLAVHAIGDRAIDQVVRVVEAVGTDPGSPIRIEHAQMISPDTARRARDLGVTLSMQPNFSDDSVHYRDRLPAGYAERNNPFRMLIDEVGFVAGEDLVFGSDGMPHGVDEALRQSLFPSLPSQQLSLEEFIAGYCIAPGSGDGEIAIQIDHEARRVATRVLTHPAPANG